MSTKFDPKNDLTQEILDNALTITTADTSAASSLKDFQYAWVEIFFKKTTAETLKAEILVNSTVVATENAAAADTSGVLKFDLVKNYDYPSIQVKLTPSASTVVTTSVYKYNKMST